MRRRRGRVIVMRYGRPPRRSWLPGTSGGGGLFWLVLGYFLAYLFFHATLGWGLF